MSSATRLFIIRHGDVDTTGGDIDSGGRFYGQLDVPLSAVGRCQAEAVATALEGLELSAVYSSDLARARDGAQLLAKPRGLTVNTDPAYREMSLGVLEGHPRDQPHEHHPTTTNKRYADMVDFAFPEGEDFRDVKRRVDPALDRLLADHPGQSVAMVAHNSVTRIVIGRCLGLALPAIFLFKQSFGCINQLELGLPGSPPGRLLRLNWTPACVF